MIVISGALVLVALVLLVLGLTMTDLPFVYASIGVSLLAFLFLVVGILQRRGEQDPAGLAPAAPEPQPVPVRERPVPVVAGPVDVSERSVPVAPERVESQVASLPEPDDDEDEELLEGGGLVLVVDGRPRYHVDGCRYLNGRDAEELDVDDARDAGFTPCGVCKPDQVLAAEQEADRLEQEQEVLDPQSDGAAQERVPAQTADVRTAPPQSAYGESTQRDVDPEPRVVPEPHIEPQPHVDPDPHVEPEPHIEPQPYVQPELYVDPAPDVEPDVEPAPAPVPVPVVPARRGSRVLDAPDPVPADAPATAPAGRAPRARKAPAGPAAQDSGNLVEPVSASPPAGTSGAAERGVPATATSGSGAKRVATALALTALAGAAVAASTSTPSSAAATGLSTVVVLPDRGKFHRAHCRYVRDAAGARELSRAQATEQGYGACGVCKP